jgi:glutathione S-transferase
MTDFSTENPVFVAYAIASALLVLKYMGQGWMTVFRMLRSNSGLASPEDLRPGLINRTPDPSQLEVNDYVDRSRRMHRNDMENIPAFWAAGLLFVATDPPLWAANLLFYGFVAARAFHALAYVSRQSHEVRATFYTVGSLIVMGMALAVLLTLLGAG